jgi:hypothetical protein
MKAEVPAEIKATLPEGKWGKVLGMTPVVMTIVATLLAGLSTSEMTKAQYIRSLAAQLQSKAGDQWGFFQAKRLRSALQSSALDTAQLTAGDIEPQADALRRFAVTIPDHAPIVAALDTLLSGQLPAPAIAPAVPASIAALLTTAEQEADTARFESLLRPETSGELESALRTARAHARAFDELLRPVIDGGDRLGEAIDSSAESRRALGRDFAVLRLRYSGLRYDAEAKLNQSIARLLDLQVRQTNLVAERHQRRSTRFFYGMLGAQAAVLVSTFALAARRRSLLWSLAASAGLVAVTFATYVYLFL